jgi:S1-C subfamily serine protease
VTRGRGGALAGAAVVLVAGAIVLAAGSRRPVHAMPAVVTVSSTAPTGAADVATGFALGPGRVVTVAHVLDPGRPLLVRTADGRVRRARIVSIDRADDLALLAVPRLGARPARTAAASAEPARILVRRGGHVVALAAAIRRTVTAHMAAPGSRPYIRPALELAAPVAVGDSGAPVVDASGAVAGIVFARSSGRPGTAYAVDARALASMRP